MDTVSLILTALATGAASSLKDTAGTAVKDAYNGLKALIEEHIDQEGEIIAAARNLMTLAQPQQAAMGKYNVQITGNVQGYAQGDNQNVTMNVGNAPEEK